MATAHKVTININKSLPDSDRWHLLHCIPDPEWRAVQETILAELETSTMYATDPTSDPGSLAHYAGQMAALRYVIAVLETCRAKGGKMEDDAE